MATQPSFETSGLLSLDTSALERLGRARPVRKRSRFWSSLAGVALALIICELLLRPYPGHVLRFDPRPLHEDRVDAAVVTMPNHAEGFAIAHFSPSRARLTGNPALPGAPYVVILGDSYVEALQVSDEQTMGSVLERTARGEGQPLNVRQYGWSGDSPAHYALVAGEVQQLWSPALVCVVLNADDFMPSALSSHWAQMQLNPGSPPAIRAVDSGSGGELRRKALRLLQQSGLLYTVVQRAVLDILPTFTRSEGLENKPGGVEDIDDPTIVDATVQALKRAYGDSLLIVLIQNPGISGGRTPTRLETLLLGACAAQNADCLATREAFADRRDRTQRFAFGFSNTLPAAGHINADGHLLLADLMRADYQRRRGGQR